MALKYIPKSWQDSLRIDPYHKFNFYMNPRQRVFPALTYTYVSYIKNDPSTNMRGTYRLQTNTNTNLTYLYTPPQRFIVEGWFRPEFNYDTAGNKVLLRLGDVLVGPQNRFELVYLATDDKIYAVTYFAATFVNKSTTAFTSNVSLQQWIYVRCFFDNVAKLNGFYCTANGTVLCDAQNTPGAGAFSPGNITSFFPSTNVESSYWIIHELDKTLATGEYKTYQADRQIVFDFNGTTLGRERILIPTLHDVNDTRGVKSFSISKSVNGPMSGEPCANKATLSLHNTEGQFSDDQYAAFDPLNGYYNGTLTQKYLQNRVAVEIETESPANTVRDGLIGHWSFDDVVTPGMDNSGNGNDGTIYGATPVEGVSGKALSFDGVNDYVNIGNTFSFERTDSFSVGFWIKTAAPGNGAGIISKGDYYGGTVGGWGVCDASGNTLRFYLAHSGSNRLVMDLPITYDNTWTYIAFTYSGTSSPAGVACYKNGIVQSLTTTVNNLSATIITATAAELGKAPSTPILLNGTIDEPRIYNRALSAAEVLWLYQHPSDWGPISKAEPLFIGRTTPGAFKRNSPSVFYSSVNIEAEDMVAELGEMRLSASHGYLAFSLADLNNEPTSLFHSIARLATQKSIKNYASNSSFENATISNSWTAGTLTLTRDATPQFGTYGAKAVASGAGQYFRQIIGFETIERIDVGDTFNFSAFIRQETASTVYIGIEELDASYGLLGTISTTLCGTDTGVFTRVNVSRTILSKDCAKLHIIFYTRAACTFYVDGVMLTRGSDPFDYFVLNSVDGTSGTFNADHAMMDTYDTVGFDVENVLVTHPYAMVNKGESPWTYLKQIAEASLASYMGMSLDNVLILRVRYNELDEDINGSVDNVVAISSTMIFDTFNSINVMGIQIVIETNDKAIYLASESGQWTKNTGGFVYHPIADGKYAAIEGATVLELVYDDKAGVK